MAKFQTFRVLAPTAVNWQMGTEQQKKGKEKAGISNPFFHTLASPLTSLECSVFNSALVFSGDAPLDWANGAAVMQADFKRNRKRCNSTSRGGGGVGGFTFEISSQSRREKIKTRLYGAEAELIFTLRWLRRDLLVRRNCADARGERWSSAPGPLRLTSPVHNLKYELGTRRPSSKEEPRIWSLHRSSNLPVRSEPASSKETHFTGATVNQSLLSQSASSSDSLQKKAGCNE